MTPEQIARAVWCANGPNTMVLKARVKDGGSVLATISGGRTTDYRWETNTTPRIVGTHWSRYGAQVACRKAVRETHE